MLVIIFKMSKKESDVTLKVLKYLEQQNRPYSVNDIFLNLHKEIGKTAVQKALDHLVQDGSVKEKTYGKQKVYIPNQDKFPPLNDAELREIDCKINQLMQEVKEKCKEIQEGETKLRALENSITTDEAVKKAHLVTEDIDRLQNKLTSLKSNQVTISQQEKERVEHDHSKMVQEWRRRKRFALDMLDAILEGYPKSKKELYEDVGIETDEDTGVSLPKS